MKIIKLTLLSSIVAFNLAALDLGSYMSRIANSDPNIIQKKKQFNSVYETLKIAEGDFFLPSIDLTAGIDKVKTKYTKPSSTTSKYTNKYFTISATENLFNGFGTINDIDAKKAALASMAYSYVQTLNEELLNASKAYIDLVRNKELLAVEVDNYNKHKKILYAISARNRSGVGVIGDLQEITAKTNLAYANYLTQLKNLKASQMAVRKFYGIPLDINSIQTPSIGYNLNYSPSEAINFSFSHNPSLFVQKYNVIVARFNKKRDEKEFFPIIDFVIAHSMVDGKDDDTDIERNYKQLKGGINLKWNLFRGFKDSHQKQKNISLIHQEYQKYEAIKRVLAEEIELAFTSYNMQQKEYEYLSKYVNSAAAKLDTITTLFRNGRKSLFEFLASQTDYNSAKEKLINTKYDLIFTKLRVLKALGILSDMVNPALKAEVGISDNGLYDYEKLNYKADKLPINENNTPLPPVTNSNAVINNSFNTYAIAGVNNSTVVAAEQKINMIKPAIPKDARFENDEKYQTVYDEEFIAPRR